MEENHAEHAHRPGHQGHQRTHLPHPPEGGPVDEALADDCPRGSTHRTVRWRHRPRLGARNRQCNSGGRRCHLSTRHLARADRRDRARCLAHLSGLLRSGSPLGAVVRAQGARIAEGSEGVRCRARDRR